MPTYLFTYNAGTAKQRVERHDWPSDEKAVHSARSRVGAIDPTIRVDVIAHAGVKLVGTWNASTGKREWSEPK